MNEILKHCPQMMTHTEARKAKRDGLENDIVASLLRMSLAMARNHYHKAHRYYDRGFAAMDDLVGVAWCAVVEAVREWQPRKHTFKRYILARIRNALAMHTRHWSETHKSGKRFHRLGKEEYQPQFAEAYLGERRDGLWCDGCLAEVEGVCKTVLPEDEAQIFGKRFGLNGYERHTLGQLAEEYGLTNRQIVGRLWNSIRLLHLHFTPGDYVTSKEVQRRLAGHRASKISRKQAMAVDARREGIAAARKRAN